jgi:hypothetical protein
VRKGREKLRFLRFAALAIAAMSFLSVDVGHCEEPAPKGVGPGTGMATRSVSLYLGLERSLQDAISGGDRESVSALLADGFEFTSGKKATLGRKEWLDREFAAKKPPALVRDLNVRETAGVATATFLLDYRPQRGNAVFSVTDTWDSATRQLQRRREVEMKSPPPPFDRPTGRE